MQRRAALGSSTRLLASLTIQDADRLAFSDCASRTLLAGVPLVSTAVLCLWTVTPRRVRRGLSLRAYIDLADLPQLDASCEVDRLRPAHLAAGWKGAALAAMNAIGAAAFAFDAARHHRASSALAAVSWSFAAAWLLFRPPLAFPRGLATLWSVQAVGSALLLRNDRRDGLGWTALIAAAAAMTVAGTYPLLAVWPSVDTAPVGVAPVSSARSPEDAVTLWQWLRVAHVDPMLKAGVSKDDLDDEDYWALSPLLSHRNVLEALKHFKGSSLFRRLLGAHARDIAVAIFMRTLSVALSFSTPLLLKRILELVGASDPNERETAYVLTAVIATTKIAELVLDLQIGWVQRRMYERVRGSIMCMVHEAALRRQITGARATSAARNLDEDIDEAEEQSSAANVGRLVNMMRGDAYSISELFWNGLSPLVGAPIIVAIALAMLYSLIGLSAFAGLIAIVLAYLFEWPLWLISLRLTRRRMAAEDVRVKVLSDLMTAIRLLKAFAWEGPWLSRASAARERELKIRWRQSLLEGGTSLVWIAMPALVPLISLASYTMLQGHHLTVPVAFAVINIYSSLDYWITLIPESIKEYIQVRISVRRVERFLAEPALPAKASTSARGDDLGLHAGTFAWAPPLGKERDKDAFVLTVPDIRFERGTFTLITGATASGKSTLLDALLGELDTLSGDGAYRPAAPRQVAVAVQSAWLENATIRENIRFHSPRDDERLDAVIDACALRPDIDGLEDGVETEIGELGVTLSGGQRARLALARAVYSPADYLLLDDVLAAVDVHTSRHIVDRLLRGPLMAGRTVIMVAHLEALLRPLASLVIHVDVGTVTLEPTKPTATSLEPMVESSSASQATLVASASSRSVSPKPFAPAPARQLMTEEKRERGMVKSAVYLRYLRAGSYTLWSILVVLFAAKQFIVLGRNWQLKSWAEAFDRPAGRLPRPQDNELVWIGLLFAWIMLDVVGLAMRTVVRIACTFRAARVLFTQALTKVVRAPSRYYDTTPVSRTLNRLVGDVGTADSALPGSVRNLIRISFQVVISIGIVVFLQPAFIPLGAIVLVAYLVAARPFRIASRALRRLEKKALSPLFSSFSTTLEGLTTIRAFELGQNFQDILFERVDKFQAYDHWYWQIVFHLQVRFDFLGIVVLVGLILISQLLNVSAGIAAVAIITAERMTQTMHDIVFAWAQLEMDLSSIERLDSLMSLETEPSEEGQGVAPAAHWPRLTGSVVFDDFSFRYSAELPDVVKHLSLEIRPGEKLGIVRRLFLGAHLPVQVGRTGSGKSTLALSLLRISDPSGGRILIDGMNIAELSLYALRSRGVTSVPQDPILMQGTVRANLDPLEQHTDADLLEALSRVCLEIALDFDIGAGASNLSSGQRQQVALARALLRNSAITVLDEATSSLDLELDLQIQAAIRESFAGGIVISIAHRLGTVIDYDRIAVMRDGELLEVGEPAVLLAREGSELRSMAQKSGELDSLKALATRAR